MSKTIRFLVSYDRNDASLYFFLSGGCRQYKYGQFDIPKSGAQFKVNCESGSISTVVPKISYHKSGIIKVNSGKIELRLDREDKRIPFNNMHWNHILSVQVASIQQLSKRRDARNSDVVVEGFTYDCGRFLIYANNDRRWKIITVDVDGTFRHPDCDLIFGYKHVNQLPLNTTGAGGIILITGWTVGQTTLIEDSGLFIQGIP